MGALQVPLEFGVDRVHQPPHPGGLVHACKPATEQACHRPAVGEERHEVNRRRSAASTSAIDRSAVFIVPMNQRFSGSENGSSGR